MTPDPDLELLLQVARQLAAAGTDSARSALDAAGLLTLALDAADLEDVLVWLTGVVRATAQANPSLGFVLAAHYTADRAATRAGVDSSVTGWRTVATPGSRADVLVPCAFYPAHVLVLDVPALATSWIPADRLEPAPDKARTGLEGARLRGFVIPPSTVPAAGPPADWHHDRDGVRDWALLMSAASLGVASAAFGAAEAYAGQRVQFGAPISSFSGLRALLSEMRLAVSAVQALLDAACADDAGAAAALDAWAFAGRAAVDVGLAAVQVHGGYGYIEEYPVAGLLRDAISLRARGAGRRAALTAAAEVRG